MNLSGIISIAGKPGLSKIISQSKNGIIVESLGDGKRFPVQGAQRVSSLEDISIYTHGEDIPLTTILEKIRKKENGAAAISHKSSAAELSAYIKEVQPDYDEERVYQSDLKKIVQWYNLLLEKGLITEPEKKEAKAKASKKAEDKPAAEKKSPKKKAAPAKSNAKQQKSPAKAIKSTAARKK